MRAIAERLRRLRKKVPTWAQLSCYFLACLVIVFAATGILFGAYLSLTSDFGRPPLLAVDKGEMPSDDVGWKNAPQCLTSLLQNQSPRESAACRQVCTTSNEPDAITGTAAEPSKDVPDDRTDFEGAALSHVAFETQHLVQSNFRCAQLEHVSFNGRNLDAADFTCAELMNVTFEQGAVRGADFTGSVMTDVTFQDTNLFLADFSCSWLRRTDIEEASLERVVLRGARYDDGSLSDSRLTDVTLAHAVFEPKPDGLPETLTTLDIEDWRTLLLRDLQLVPASSGEFVVSVGRSARRFEDAMASLRGLAGLLEEKPEASRHLRSRMEQLRLLWLSRNIEDENGAGKLWLQTVRGFRLSVDFLTSNGTQKWRLFGFLFAFWGVGTICFLLRFWHLRSVRDDAAYTICRAETVKKKEEGRTVEVETLVPVRPDFSGAVFCSAALALKAGVIEVVQAVFIKAGWYPAILNEAVEKANASRLRGTDRNIYWMLDTCVWLIWALGVLLLATPFY